MTKSDTGWEARMFYWEVWSRCQKCRVLFKWLGPLAVFFDKSWPQTQSSSAVKLGFTRWNSSIIVCLNSHEAAHDHWFFFQKKKWKQQTQSEQKELQKAEWNTSLLECVYKCCGIGRDGGENHTLDKPYFVLARRSTLFIFLGGTY